MKSEELPLELRGLSKGYGVVRAVDGVSFEVRSGEIYGLLGPNGAGKTTTLSMVCGLLRPDAGEVRVFGHIEDEIIPPSGEIRVERSRPKSSCGSRGEQPRRLQV
ncbi:MAG: putative transporter ATP-binding protein YxlF, partial [Verrucomicrobiota bacterium]